MLTCRVCESVATGLVGQKLAGFTGISSAVKTAVEGALTRILTPKRSIDILRDIAAAKAKGKPYTIVFVGVNGVGKSTNLAKVAYWLLQNNISVGLSWPKLAGYADFLSCKLSGEYACLYSHVHIRAQAFIWWHSNAIVAICRHTLVMCSLALLASCSS